MSKVSVGNEFRDKIRDLISLAGWRPDTERQVGGKNSDVLFVKSVNGRPFYIAVEAKNWGKQLGQTELEKIVGGYVAAQQGDEINELWIVAPLPLKGGKTYIEKLRWVQFFTLEKLLTILMDFGSYLNDLIFDHEHGGLEEYYISPQARLENDPSDIFNLDNYLDGWLSGTDSRPLAIVEGYGTGKTSVARHLAYLLANRFVNFQLTRIPIYVELGRLTNQQDLTGLFGSLFTNDHRVDNYSYPLFKRMNEMGNFLIILDGFDEMKHLMTRIDFEYNFQQLNKLVEGDARVILLGRPSAFSSDDEREYLLHGRRPLDGEMAQDPSRPNYVEIRLERFNTDQVAEFVERFLKYKAKTVASGATPLTDEIIEKRIEEILTQDYGDLLERPVQARMLAEIATVYTRPLGELNRFRLYERFMGDLIDREMEKQARHAFDRDVRRKFSQELSWWMWQSNKTLGIRQSDIPDDVFTTFSSSDHDLEAVRRDLISGSFLDPKEGGLFIVPHRSMLEFMVAEHIIGKASRKELDTTFLRQFSPLLTSVVLTFIFESGDRAFVSAIDEALLDYQGSLPSDFLVHLAGEEMVAEAIKARPKSQWSPWHLELLSMRRQVAAPENPEQECNAHIADLEVYLSHKSGDPLALASAVLSILPLSIFEIVTDTVVNAIVTFMLRYAAISRLKFKTDGRGDPRTILLDTNDTAGLLIDAFRLSISADISAGSLNFKMKLNSLAFRLGNLMNPRYVIAEDSTTTSRKTAWPMPRLTEVMVIPYNDLHTDQAKKNWGRNWDKNWEKNWDKNWETLRQFLIGRPNVATKQRR